MGPGSGLRDEVTPSGEAPAAPHRPSGRPPVASSPETATGKLPSGDAGAATKRGGLMWLCPRKRPDSGHCARSAKVVAVSLANKMARVGWAVLAKGESYRPKTICYSITSSAVARSVGGMARPSALAAFRLTTIKYFVGNCTGSSEGVAPRRMLST